MEKQLIVGVDPGTSVGLAFLDVDGNVLEVISRRNISIDDCIMEIASRGSAVVVASDKKDCPPFVSKVASIMGARIFCPDYDLFVDKKRELAKVWNTNNDHERDSLAAAVYASNKFQNKIRRIEKQVAEELERTKARVLKGEKVSDIFAPEKSEDGRIKELSAQLAAERREVKRLQSELGAASSKKGRVNVRAILKEAGKEAKSLMLDVAKKKLVLLKELPSLNYLELKDIGIKKGDYIICRNKSWDGKGLRYLEAKRVGAIINPMDLDTLAPVCSLDAIGIVSWEGLFFADPVDIEMACGRKKEVEARDLHDMLVDYKKGRR